MLSPRKERPGLIYGGHSLPFGTIKGNADVRPVLPPHLCSTGTQSRCVPGTHTASRPSRRVPLCFLSSPLHPQSPILASGPHLPAWAASSDTAFWLWPSALSLAQAPGSTPPQLGHQALGLPPQPMGRGPTKSAHPNRHQTQGPDCFGRWAFCREGKVFGSTEQEGSSQPLGVSTLDFHLTVMAKET